MEARTIHRVRFGLLALAFIVFGGKSHEVLLRGIDSNIHAAVAMSVTSPDAVAESQSQGEKSKGEGSLIPQVGIGLRLPIPMKNFSSPAVPRPQDGNFAFDSNKTFNDHPFFYFWLNGAVMRALGPDAFSARLLTGLSGVGCVWVLFEILLMGLGPSSAFLGAFLLIASRDFVLTAGTMSLDPPMIFMLLLTFYFWMRRKVWALGVVAGMGLWIKTPVVLLIYPTAFATVVVQTGLRHLEKKRDPQQANRALSSDFKRLFSAFSITILIGSAFWSFVAWQGGVAMVRDYWTRQLIGTALGGRDGQANFPWTYVFDNLRTGFIPGLFFLPFAAFSWARSGKLRQDVFLLPFLGFWIFSAILGMMKFKLGSYYTPIFPLAAWISSLAFHHALRRRIEWVSEAFLRLVLVIAVFLVVTPTPLAPEALVALKRFTPLIQFQGTCDDEVLLISGGEPAGSSLDYQLFLNFYTGRTVSVASCTELAGKLEKRPPEWMILSEENYRGCLTSKDRSFYPYRYLVGNQLLLRSERHAARDRSLKEGVLDLTPLEGELKAVTDCRPPHLPKDRWHRYLKN